MSGAIRLPKEIEELFKYSDQNGRLDEEDLQEAGYEKQNSISNNYQIWEKEDTVVRYNSENRSIENYRELG